MPRISILKSKDSGGGRGSKELGEVTQFCLTYLFIYIFIYIYATALFKSALNQSANTQRYG